MIGLHEYQIERLEKSRFGDLTALYKAVYGRAISENFFPRKYYTAYTRHENLGYIAYKGSIAVAFYGVIPTLIEYEKKTVSAAQSADTMTHPDHRKKGLFAHLARLTYDLCQESGIKFVFGFPNQNSYHGLSKTLQWKQTETLDSFTIPIGSRFITRATKKFALTKPFYSGYLKSIIQKYQTGESGVPNSVVRDGFSGVQRDAQYLRYKDYSDTIVIQAGTAKIWIAIKGNLWIGDLANVENSKDLTTAIEELKKFGQKLGLSSINFQASPGTSLHRLFAREYESFPSFATMFLDLGANLVFENIKFTLADIDIF